MTDRRDPSREQVADWQKRFRSVEWTLLPNPPLEPRAQNAMDEVLLEEMAAGPHLAHRLDAERVLAHLQRLEGRRDQLQHLGIEDDLLGHEPSLELAERGHDTVTNR